MKRITLIAFTFTLLLASAAVAEAQVKRVQMHIDGYLCGN
jgi:hypothetical protein